MPKGRVFYQDAIVVRQLRLGEEKSLLSLLSIENGLFTCSSKRNATQKKRAMGGPQLFTTIRSCFRKTPGESYQLLSFESLGESFHRGPVMKYLSLCLLARLTVLMVRESPQEDLFFKLWMKHLQTSREPQMTTLLAEFHFAHGTWPAFEICERCHGPLQDIFVENSEFICKKCASSHSNLLSENQQTWLKGKFVCKEEPGLQSRELRKLAMVLKSRLPESVQMDKIFKKCLLQLNP